MERALLSAFAIVTIVATAEPASAGESAAASLGPRREPAPSLTPWDIDYRALGHRELPYASGEAVPFGYHLELLPNKPLLVTGAVMLTTTYTIAAGMSLFTTAAAVHQPSPGTWPLTIPVAGPFIGLATVRLHDHATLISSLLGAGQVLGLGLLVTGAALRSPRLVRDDVRVAERWRPGRAMPLGYEERSSPRKELYLPGATAVAAGWLGSLVWAVGCGESCRVDGVQYPIVGPYVLAAHRGWDAATAVDAVVQTGGFVAVVAGLVWWRHALQPDPAHEHAVQLAPRVGVGWLGAEARW